MSLAWTFRYLKTLRLIVGSYEIDAVDNDPTLAAASATTLPTQQAVKAYVDGVASGIVWKTAVQAATTAAGVLATDFAAGQVIDDYTLVLGDRILIKDQAAGATNGIYTVTGGVPTRTADANSGALILKAGVEVLNGTVNGDSKWVCITPSPINFGVTTLTFGQIGAGEEDRYLAGTGLTLTDETFAIDGTVATLAGTQTLTNKTLTSPKLNEAVALTAKATDLNQFVGLANLAKEIITVQVSFDTGEQATVPIYFPYKVAVNKIRGVVTKVIGGSDNGTITGANSTGNSATGVITCTASDAVGQVYSVSPTTNNVVAANSFYSLTTLKTTAGGKVLVTLEVTRTA